MSSCVLVSVRVSAAPQRAFDVFTRDIGLWWQPNSLFKFTPQGVGMLSFEGGANGRLIETQADGSVFEIGPVTAWEPGVRLAFGWAQASFSAEQRTHVEVRFEAIGDETRVTVEHRGWDSVPQDHAARHHFPDGIFLLRHGQWWQALLGSYSARVVRDDPLDALPR